MGAKHLLPGLECRNQGRLLIVVRRCTVRSQCGVARKAGFGCGCDVRGRVGVVPMGLSAIGMVCGVAIVLSLCSGLIDQRRGRSEAGWVQDMCVELRVWHDNVECQAGPYLVRCDSRI